MKNIFSFFHFMQERQQIYLNRQAGKPRPWTKDKILQQYKFTNVFREQDFVTIWIRENWRDPFHDHPHLWFAMCIARQINWPETLEEIGFPKDGYDAQRLEKILTSRMDRGEKAYTGAYIVPAPQKGGAKPPFTANVVLGYVWAARKWIEPKLHNTLAEAHFTLTRFPRWTQGFIAYEVVTDLRHTRYLRNAPDKFTWAHAGKGAVRGLNRIFGRPVTALIKQCMARQEMLTLLEMAPQFLPEWFPELEMRDIEHSLCEFDKYERARLGQGKPRSRYQGGGGDFPLAA